MEPLSNERALEIKNELFDLCGILKSTGIRLNNAFIAGGCITSMLQNEEPKDYDFFFENKADFAETILSLKEFKLEHETYNTKAAHTLKYKGVKFQFISRRYGTPQKTMEEFDFFHTKAWYDINAHKLHISNFAYECAKKKLLIFNNIKDTSLHRAGAFFRRGYKMPMEQYELLTFEFWKPDVELYFDDHGIRLVNDIACFMYFPEHDKKRINVEVS